MSVNIRPRSYQTYEGSDTPTGLTLCPRCNHKQRKHQPSLGGPTWSLDVLDTGQPIQSSFSDPPPPSFGAPTPQYPYTNTQQSTYGTGINQNSPAGVYPIAPQLDYGTLQGSTQAFSTDPYGQGSASLAPTPSNVSEAGDPIGVWTAPPSTRRRAYPYGVHEDPDDEWGVMGLSQDMGDTSYGAYGNEPDYGPSRIMFDLDDEYNAWYSQQGGSRSSKRPLSQEVGRQKKPRKV